MLPGKSLLGVSALALARLISLVAAVDDVGGYTWGALLYEVATAALAAITLRKN